MTKQWKNRRRQLLLWFRGFVLLVITLILLLFLFNIVRVYRYSYEYYDHESDVAIVLGAGTRSGKVSPVFRERLNHAIYLIKAHKVDYVILTGGKGKGQVKADSEVAQQYLLDQGVEQHKILIEKKSRYTIENLCEAKSLMDSLRFENSLLVSDPLHMLRSMKLAKNQDIECHPSPTRTSMYRSWRSKTQSLVYESYYLTLRQIHNVLS